MIITIEEIGTNQIEQCHPEAGILSLMKTGAGLEPGDPVPAGRCAECDELVYPIISNADKLANSRRIAADNDDIAVDALGKLAVARKAAGAAQDAIKRVEAVCERWSKHTPTIDEIYRGVALIFQDNRFEIIEALK